MIAADRNLLDGSHVESGGVLETVRVTPYSGNGLGRVVSWCSYAVTATFRALCARRVDVVYGSSPHLLAGLAAWLVARVRRVPFVLEVRDLWPRVLVDMGALDESSLTYRALHRLERFLYRRADRVVILASGAREHVTRHGVPDEAVVFIPNGADAEDFVPTRPAGASQALRLRRRCGGVHRCPWPSERARSLLDGPRARGVVPRAANRPHRRWREEEGLVAGLTREGCTNVTSWILFPSPRSETSSPPRTSVSTVSLMSTFSEAR